MSILHGSSRLALAILIASLLPVSAHAITASDCLGRFRRAFDHSALGSGKRSTAALQALEAYLRSPEGIRSGHTLRLPRFGKPILEIKTLGQSQKRFMILALKAVREGSLSRIDAGTIVGPKALILLQRLRRELAAAPGEIEITGNLYNKLIFPKFESQSETAFKANDPRSWTPKEKVDFERAIDELDVKLNCREFWKTESLADCGKLNFRLRIGKGVQKLTWSRGFH